MWGLEKKKSLNLDITSLGWKAPNQLSENIRALGSGELAALANNFLEASGEATRLAAGSLTTLPGSVTALWGTSRRYQAWYWLSWRRPTATRLGIGGILLLPALFMAPLR